MPLPHSPVHTFTRKAKACTTRSFEIPFQSRIQMAHAATDTWHQAPSIITGQRAPVEPEIQWWRKGDAKMGTVFRSVPCCSGKRDEKERDREAEGRSGDLRGHNKYQVRTRSGATYAVSDNDGVCSGCLLSEQISE